MDLYTPDARSDAFVFRLYSQLLDTKDIFAYPPKLYSLSGFLATMQAPTVLFFELDSEEGQPWIAAWFEPQPLGYAVVNLWVREDRRRQRESLRAVMELLAHGFKEWETLVAYSGDPAVTQLYEHFGLARHSPDLYVGENAITLLSLTRQQFSVMKKVA